MLLRFALVGPVEAGKSTLFHALRDDPNPVRKTQAVEYGHAGSIDTPGEFISHPGLYHALIQSVSDVDTIVYVHPANVAECRVPPGLLDIYRHRLIGVITKIDLPDAEPDLIESMLREQGFEGDIFRVCSHWPDTVAALKAELVDSSAAPSPHGERT